MGDINATGADGIVRTIKLPAKRDRVIAVDSVGVRHEALVTNHWNLTVNVVFVTADETKTDSYGSQVERMTSCVHKTLTSSPGYFWFWPGEEG
jgi:hypothetical protein